MYTAFVQAVTGKQPRSIGPKDLETASALVDMGAEPADLPPLLDWLKTQTPFKNGFSFAAVKSQYLAWRTSQPRPVHANGCGPKSQADLAALPYGAWKQGVYQNLQQWRADKRAGCLAQLDGSRPDVR